MNYIVGDIGNTSTKICLFDDKSQILKSIIFDTKNIFLKGHFKKKFQKKLIQKILRKKYCFHVSYQRHLNELNKF